MQRIQLNRRHDAFLLVVATIATTSRHQNGSSANARGLFSVPTLEGTVHFSWNELIVKTPDQIRPQANVGATFNGGRSSIAEVEIVGVVVVVVDSIILFGGLKMPVPLLIKS